MNANSRRVVVGCLLVVVAFSAWQHYQKCAKPSRLGTQTRTAFLRWRPQLIGDETPGRGSMPGLKQGDDIYRLYNYPNPPILALTLWPLAELPTIQIRLRLLGLTILPGEPVAAGAMLWFFLKVGMAGLALLWAYRLCGPMPDWAKLLALLFSLHPLLGDLSHGNVNIYIAFLCLGALELYRRGWDVTAGIVLALAIACKITPALFVPYFGWKLTSSIVMAIRAKEKVLPAAWNSGGKILLGCILGLGIWFFAVPGATLGWKHNLVLLESWYDVMAKPFLVEGEITSEHANQSIPGAVVRLLTDEPSSIDWDEDDKPIPGGYHTIADIGPDNARVLIRVCQTIWVGVLLWLGWANVSKRDNRTGLLFAAECGYVLLGMLLFSERTWKHHATTLMLPFAVLFAVLASGALTRRWRIALYTMLGAVLLLQFGPSLGPEAFQDGCLAYGSHTLLFLLLIASTASVMRHQGRNTMWSSRLIADR